MKVIRVFPRRTKATPIDPGVRVNEPPGLYDEADEVRISIAFTRDLPAAERLERWWQPVAPVKIGGPATRDRHGDFVPGQYLKRGYVVTSRGCPRRCWFCDVWRRFGKVRELPITEGNDVLDDNLLACSPDHVRSVFAMLNDQPGAVRFTGGLEAARLEPWHADALRSLRPDALFFAYDTPDDLEALRAAGELLRSVGFTIAGHRLRAYVLCGYDGDTFDAAEQRMRETVAAGFYPMAMVHEPTTGPAPSDEWRRFAAPWIRPARTARVLGHSPAPKSKQQDLL